MPITVNWGNVKWRDLLNERFVPLIHNKDRYLILYGGRGSAKSNAVAKKLIFRCLSEKYFRYILIRNQYNTIKDSSYQTIKDIIIELGLEKLFVFKLQPLEIHCVNGNMFMARGCDDTTTLKSVKDPTGCWFEEDIPSESDFITITSSIRTQKADYLQEVFTINPEVQGNYQDHWFWKKYFEGKNELSFNSVTKMKVDDTTEVDLTYTVHHSTYLDNRWLPPEFKAILLDLKRTNPYYYTIYTLGHWGNKQLGGRFYKKFDIGKNTANNKYNPEMPLHISFDFNTKPYTSVSIWQVSGKFLYNIDEIATENPNNDTKSLCREFMYKYNSHNTGLFVYGDPSGNNNGTTTEQGFNNYTIIMDVLAKYNPVLRVASKHPPVHMRGMFINACFDHNFDGVHIIINEKSTYLKNDLLFGKENHDGDKLKEMTTGPDGSKYQKYHHFSDNMDYFICELLQTSFANYQRGDMSQYKRHFGNNQHRADKRL